MSASSFGSEHRDGVIRLVPETDEIVAVRLEGDFDLANAPALGDQIDRALDGDGTRSSGGFAMADSPPTTVSHSRDRDLAVVSVYRDINDRIYARHSGHIDSADFICECADEACVEMIRVSRETYVATRAAPHRFLVLAEHTVGDGGRVLHSHNGYRVMEQRGAEE